MQTMILNGPHETTFNHPEQTHQLGFETWRSQKLGLDYVDWRHLSQALQREVRCLGALQDVASELHCLVLEVGAKETLDAVAAGRIHRRLDKLRQYVKDATHPAHRSAQSDQTIPSPAPTEAGALDVEAEGDDLLTPARIASAIAAAGRHPLGTVRVTGEVGSPPVEEQEEEEEEEEEAWSWEGWIAHPFGESWPGRVLVRLEQAPDGSIIIGQRGTDAFGHESWDEVTEPTEKAALRAALVAVLGGEA